WSRSSTDASPPDSLAQLAAHGKSGAPGKKSKGAEMAPFIELTRQRPTLPHRCQRSTIGPGGLNFRVRDGNGCGPSGIATGNRTLAPAVLHRRAEHGDSRA